VFIIFHHFSSPLNVKARSLARSTLSTLREQGWKNIRISKVLGVDRSIIGRWLEGFRQMPKVDQPSPTPQPDPELLRLQKELAARDEFERQQEQEAERLRKELKAAKNVPASEPVIVERVVEKPVVSPELEKRVKEN
jgi:hypothetical protein